VPAAGAGFILAPESTLHEVIFWRQLTCASLWRQKPAHVTWALADKDIVQTLECQQTASLPTVIVIDRLLVIITLHQVHQRAFSYAGPSAWNRLPEDIRAESDIANFRKLLKTHYFSSVFNVR